MDVEIQLFLSDCKTKIDIPYLSELSIRKTLQDFRLNHLILSGKITDNTGILTTFGTEQSEELLFTVNEKDNRLIFLFIAVIDGEYPMYMEINDFEIDRWDFPRVKISDKQKSLVSEIFRKVKSYNLDLNAIERVHYYDEYRKLVKSFVKD